MNSLSFLNHHHSHIGSCRNSVRYVMPEPPMAHPGGNENNSNPPQVGLGVAPMVTRGAPCSSRMRWTTSNRRRAVLKRRSTRSGRSR
ncbi:hypothetical protein M0R45_018261 [Rubus argutus]|uniref:Uncharacterized protein n=1 Tax=Rubus argutus TaxID=59490 RepID=A0AAW1X219_RUBAR